MTAVDVCRLNKHDSPDLVYGRHDGTVFKRLINAFSFRPTVVATVPVNAVFANNPYAQNVRPTITNIPMINVRLVSFQTVSPVHVGSGGLAGGTPMGPDDVNLNDAVNQVQTFIEGNMLVNRVTNVISSRQVLFFYVDRRAHVMNVGMRHFNLNNLPKSVAGLERTNEKPVNVPPLSTVVLVQTKMVETGKVVPNTTYVQLFVKTTPYTDVVGTTGMATEGLSDVALVTGSTAMVMDNGTVATGPVGQLSAPDLNNEQWMYDPVAINSAGDNVECWKYTNR